MNEIYNSQSIILLFLIFVLKIVYSEEIIPIESINNTNSTNNTTNSTIDANLTINGNSTIDANFTLTNLTAKIIKYNPTTLKGMIALIRISPEPIAYMEYNCYYKIIQGEGPIQNKTEFSESFKPCINQTICGNFTYIEQSININHTHLSSYFIGTVYTTWGICYSNRTEVLDPSDLFFINRFSPECPYGNVVIDNKCIIVSNSNSINTISEDLVNNTQYVDLSMILIIFGFLNVLIFF